MLEYKKILKDNSCFVISDYDCDCKFTIEYKGEEIFKGIVIQSNDLDDIIQLLLDKQFYIVLYKNNSFYEYDIKNKKLIELDNQKSGWFINSFIGTSEEVYAYLLKDSIRYEMDSINVKTYDNAQELLDDILGKGWDIDE